MSWGYPPRQQSNEQTGGFRGLPNDFGPHLGHTDTTCVIGGPNDVVGNWAPELPLPWLPYAAYAHKVVQGPNSKEFNLPGDWCLSLNLGLTTLPPAACCQAAGTGTPVSRRLRSNSPKTQDALKGSISLGARRGARFLLFPSFLCWSFVFFKKQFLVSVLRRWLT